MRQPAGGRDGRISFGDKVGAGWVQCEFASWRGTCHFLGRLLLAQKVPVVCSKVKDTRQSRRRIVNILGPKVGYQGEKTLVQITRPLLVFPRRLSVLCCLCKLSWLDGTAGKFRGSAEAARVITRQLDPFLAEILRVRRPRPNQRCTMGIDPFFTAKNG